MKDSHLRISLNNIKSNNNLLTQIFRSALLIVSKVNGIGITVACLYYSSQQEPVGKALVLVLFEALCTTKKLKHFF